MRILLDVTRTLVRSRNSTPTGIDRVELAYLSHLMAPNSGHEVHFVLSTPVGSCIVPLSRMATLFRSVSGRWNAAHASTTPHHAKLLAFLHGPLDLSRKVPAHFVRDNRDPWSFLPVAELTAFMPLGVRKLSKLVGEARKTPTFYIHASHTGLESGKGFHWLRGSGIHSLFLIHDVIPIDYPEFCGDRAEAKHRMRMATVSTFCKAIMTNSHYSKERIEKYFADNGMPALPIVVSWLGTEGAADGARIETPKRTAVPYFVHVGTIEGRKNITHLLDLWRRMLQTRAPETIPRLVIAGRRGWKCQNVIDALDRSHELACHVIEVADLDDAQMASLVMGSSGMLCPSLVEGFGLPAAEALCLGVPVIASDIPAYREILGDAATIIDWSDGPAWATAIDKLTGDDDFRRQKIAAARRFRPVSWTQHVESALEQGIAAALSAPSAASPVGR